MYRCISEPYPRYLHACLLAEGSSFFELVEISITTVDSRLQAVSAISSWVAYSNLNDPASIDWPFPLNKAIDTASMHV